MEDEIIVKNSAAAFFHSGLFRVYTITDLAGANWWGLKNIIAISRRAWGCLGAENQYAVSIELQGLPGNHRSGRRNGTETRKHCSGLTAWAV